MDNTHSQATFLLMFSCMLAVCSANRGWPHFRFNYTCPFTHPSQPPLPPRPPPPPQSSNKIVVGGPENWRFGFDYNDWALKNGPFYVNDTLVFKYDPSHSVYLLPNMWSLNRCDLRRAKMIANGTQGSGEGFEFVLKQWKPYFFVCGEGKGFHCKKGSMKFFVMPAVRGWY